MIFYFSGTGNSRWVAEQFGRMLDDRLYAIAGSYTDIQAKGIRPAYTVRPDEKIGFVFPVYSWGPPALVLSFIREMVLDNYKKNYIYFICTCGDDVGQTGHILHKALRRKGYELQAGFSVFMPNTYVSLPGFKIDDPTTSQRKVDETRERIGYISKVIKNRTCNHFELFKGGMPSLKSYVVRPLFNRFLLTDKPFKALSTCISCGRCVQVCPVGNIRLEKGRPRWSGHCTSCLACFHHCPTNAIQFGNMTKGKMQYHPSTYLKRTDRSTEPDDKAD